MLYVFSDLLIFCDEPTKSDTEKALLTVYNESVVQSSGFLASG